MRALLRRLDLLATRQADALVALIDRRNRRIALRVVCHLEPPE